MGAGVTLSGTVVEDAEQVVSIRGCAGDEAGPELPRRFNGTIWCAVVGAVAAIVFGGLTLLPLWKFYLHMWLTDPLRSIGAFFPVLSLLGVLVAWRRIGWEFYGRSWGLVFIAVAFGLSRVANNLNLWIGYREIQVALLHFFPVLPFYAVGATLFFGGPRLLRASLGPLCLLLLLNPVPHFFNHLVDLPLQQLSATTARAFAHGIGLQPTGNQLRMMFAPDFGMMIVPGCNGVRGSVTFAYLALVFGYALRLRMRSLALVTSAAFLLGYVLNLLHLCILVLYYWLGLSVPSIQSYGVGVDYAIGCTVFLLSAAGLGLIIRSLASEAQAEASGWATSPFFIPSRSRTATARSLALTALSLCCLVPQLRSAPDWSIRPNEEQLLRSMPATVGSYRLLRTYSEQDTDGSIVLALGDYEDKAQAPGQTSRLTLGLWVGSPDHRVVESRRAQGLVPTWTGSFDAITSTGLPVNFRNSFYDDGISLQEDTEAACAASGCSLRVLGSFHKGWIAFDTRFGFLGFVHTTKHLPILLRREWPRSDPASPVLLRTRFEEDVKDFTRQLDLASLVDRFGSMA